MNGNSKIITFYSYKGGVGRSMALANVALLLAEEYKVIVVDWDLDIEDPGLTNIFDIDKEQIKIGLIDLFNSYKDMLKRNEVPTNEDLIDIDKYLLKIDYDFNSSSIYLLPSGCFDNNYAKKVNNFDWEDFYENYNGYGFINYLKEKLKDKADFILVHRFHTS